nr:MAG TPA: hypothetical protein [Bacteriophage sp.]
MLTIILNKCKIIKSSRNLWNLSLFPEEILSLVHNISKRSISSLENIFIHITKNYFSFGIF